MLLRKFCLFLRSAVVMQWMTCISALCFVCDCIIHSFTYLYYPIAYRLSPIAHRLLPIASCLWAMPYDLLPIDYCLAQDSKRTK